VEENQLLRAGSRDQVDMNTFRQDKDRLINMPAGGRLVPLQVGEQPGYLIEPTSKVDPQRRWIWIAPSWVAEPLPVGVEGFYYGDYNEAFLAKGFHIAGVDVGISCGNPPGVATFQQLYELLVSEYNLHPKTRLFATSNGGLMTYNWAARHPEAVDRIFAIYPVTDMRTWPGLEKACGIAPWPDTPAPYPGMTVAELEAKLGELNPIEQLAPLAGCGVKILHLHGDQDELVPLTPNSMELVRRYKALGGDAELVVIPGAGHGGPWVTSSPQTVEFLTTDE
jgi:pimeloyl-ACP methyl ester carboxylesterase